MNGQNGHASAPLKKEEWNRCIRTQSGDHVSCDPKSYLTCVCKRKRDDMKMNRKVVHYRPSDACRSNSSGTHLHVGRRINRCTSYHVHQALGVVFTCWGRLDHLRLSVTNLNRSVLKWNLMIGHKVHCFCPMKMRCQKPQTFHSTHSYPTFLYAIDRVHSSDIEASCKRAAGVVSVRKHCRRS